KARGRAAHAGLAHADGVNAIAALAVVVQRVEAITDYRLGVTLNVGLIRGGTSTNTVPGEACCEIDARYEQPEDQERVVKALQAAIDAPMPDRLQGTAFELSGGFHRLTMQPTPENRALMRRYAVHARAAGLGAEEAPLQGGGSDANILASHGIPCIDGLGPAGSGVHQTSEQCNLTNLHAKTLALHRFLLTVPPAR
ncbi:MAG TPA: M20/M25/M40 family metallo-hydrolase, partial [Polyangiaceae bacterium]|nr:M20/M25/M40 family metallo-hydrolase [Polyangiaceae bacterium]